MLQDEPGQKRPSVAAPENIAPANTAAPPEIPDSVPLSEFMYDERYGRWSTSKARNPYTCGVTGKTYTSKQVPERIDLLARAIAKRLGFSPNEGTEWDRVVAVYSVNAVRKAGFLYEDKSFFFPF